MVARSRRHSLAAGFRPGGYAGPCGPTGGTDGFADWHRTVVSLPPVSQEQIAVGLEDVVQFKPCRWLKQAAIEDPFGVSARE